MKQTVQSNQWIYPRWCAPRHVRGVFTTRMYGHSTGMYASFNLADHVGDDDQAVLQNRRLLEDTIEARPVWLIQKHSTRVARLDAQTKGPVEADAAVTWTPGIACAVMVADCLPVLLCDRAGRVVAAAHAGWRGLADGILGAVIGAMGVPPEIIVAALGPCIGPNCFEVGAEVRERFLAADPDNDVYFRPQDGKWLGDLAGLAVRQLEKLGVHSIDVSARCTTCDNRLFSYRRDYTTGRFAGLVWIEPIITC